MLLDIVIKLDRWVVRRICCPACAENHVFVYPECCERVECSCGAWLQLPPLYVPPKIL